jgi:hypothetical protein
MRSDAAGFSRSIRIAHNFVREWIRSGSHKLKALYMPG